MDCGKVGDGVWGGGRLSKYMEYIMILSATGINSFFYPVNVRKQQAGSVYCKNNF